MKFNELFKNANLNKQELITVSEDENFANKLGFKNAIEYYSEGETQYAIYNYTKLQYRNDAINALNKISKFANFKILV